MSKISRAPETRYQVRIAASIVARSGNVPMLTDTVGQRCVVLRTDDPPKLMELVRVRLSLPGGHEITVNAMVTKVTRATDAGSVPGAHLEFYALDGEPSRRWDDFMTFVRKTYPNADAKPVTLAEKGATDQIQRRHVRHAAAISVQVEWRNAVTQHTTSDVSAVGMFVQTSDPPPVGAIVRVQLTDARASEPFSCDCVVRRRVFGSNGGVGVEFMSAADGVRTSFAQALRPIVDILEPREAVVAEEPSASMRPTAAPQRRARRL